MIRITIEPDRGAHCVRVTSARDGVLAITSCVDRSRAVRAAARSARYEMRLHRQVRRGYWPSTVGT